MERRAVLVSVGAMLTGTSAGCTDYFGAEDPAVQLGWFAVDNFDREPQTFELRVVRNGAQVYHSSETVPGRTENRVPGAVAECTWGDTPGAYTVGVRVEGGKRAEQDLTAHLPRDAECVFVAVSYSRHENGEFSFLTSDNSTADCSDVARYEGGCPVVNGSE